MLTAQDRVRVLSEALPYIQRFSDCLIVIKHGAAIHDPFSMLRGVS